MKSSKYRIRGQPGVVSKSLLFPFRAPSALDLKKSFKDLKQKSDKLLFSA